MYNNEPQTANKRPFSKATTYFSVLLLFSISFGISLMLNTINSVYAAIALASGAILGLIVGNFFALETIYVFGSLAIMFGFFTIVGVAPFLPVAWLKPISVCFIVSLVGAAASIVIRWLTNNWLRRGFGMSKALIISALSIALGIIVQHYAIG